jgi:hypothetical protein
MSGVNSFGENGVTKDFPQKMESFSSRLFGKTSSNVGISSSFADKTYLSSDFLTPTTATLTRS